MKTIFFIVLCILNFSCYLLAFDKNEIKKQSGFSQKSILFVENQGQITDQFHHQRKDIVCSVVLANNLTAFIGNGFIEYQFSKTISSTEIPQKPEDIFQHSAKEDALEFSMCRMKVELLGANKHSIATKMDYPVYQEQIYNESEKIIKARTFNKIVFQNIYPGIDWILKIDKGSLKHEFLLHVGSNANQIQLQYQGSEKLLLNINGSISAKTAQGIIFENAPFCFEGNGKNVRAAYVINENILTYKIDSYKGILTIDPSISWSTYYGGNGNDHFRNVATDKYGNIYAAGETQSVSNIATIGAFQTIYGGGNYDALLVKFDSSGSRIWTTYYGGTGLDYGFSVTVDSASNVYLSGITGSTNGIASSGAYQAVYANAYDAFLVKFDENGNRIWGTYFGGSGLDQGYGIVSDHSGHIYMTGSTGSSSGIATSNGYKTMYGGGSADAFLAKFDLYGNLLQCTYLGGSAYDYGIGLACDLWDNILWCGYSGSTSGIAINTAFQTTYGGGGNDAFIVKINPNGYQSWSSYYGGYYNDYGEAVTTDAAGNIYMTGYSNSNASIASSGAFISNHFAGTDDAFLAKFNSNGNRIWGTYVGNTGDDYGYGLACENNGNIILTGSTSSINGMTTNDAYQSIYGGGSSDIFISIFSTSGNRIWGSYLGGNNDEIAYGLTVNSGHDFVVSGYTASAVGITSNGSYQSTFGGGTTDGLLANFNNCTAPDANSIYGPDKICVGNQAYFTTNVASGVWQVSDTAIAIMNTSGLLTAKQSGNCIVYFSVNNDCGSDSLFKTITVNNNSIGSNNLLNYAGLKTICPGSNLQLEAPNGFSYQWNSGDTLQLININAAGNYFAILTDSIGCIDSTNEVSVTISPLPTSLKTKAIGLTTVCDPNSVSFKVDPYATNLYGFNFQWKIGGSPIIGATDTTYMASGVGGGSVTLTVYGSNCTKTSAAKTYLIKPLPVATFTTGSSTTICAGGCVTFTAPTILNYTYAWLKDSTTNGGGTTKTVKLAGTYAVIAKLRGCADTSEAMSVIVNPLPLDSVVAITPASFCAGDSCTMNAKPIDGTKYCWYSGANLIDSTAVPNYVTKIAGVYKVMVTNQNGCVGKLSTTKVTTKVNAIPTPTIMPSGTPITIAANGSMKLKATPASSVIWQWHKDGVAIANATANAYTATSAGNYTVAITKLGCTGVSAATVVLQNGVREETATIGFNENSFELTAYPNPVNDVLTITISGIEKANNASITILNSVGQLIAMKPISTSDNCQLTTEYWSSGIYFIRYKDAKDRTGMVKVVKE